MKFIILDEDEILKDSIYCYLTGKGHSVERTLKEKEVLTLINKEHVDVLIADSSLINNNGTVLSKIIKEEKPRTKVVLMNGIANNKNHGNAVMQEACNLYRKPLDSQKLHNAIEEIKIIIGKNN